ncbi:MAG: sulfite exporter TauE/SafE family protein [Lachnospirales bacterium]
MGKKILSAIIGVVTGLLNGFFGAGGGTILVPAMERFLKTEEHKAHATAILVILPLCIISAFLYCGRTDIDFKSLILVSIGGIIGGFTGAKVLGKVPKKWLHIIFGGFMIIAGVRMIC